MSDPVFLFVNGVASPTSALPVTTLLESHPGAYTTFRTHNNGLEFHFWERHLRRLSTSTSILFNSCPNLLFCPGINLTPVSLQQMKSLEWDSLIPSLVNNSMTKAIPVALKERKPGTELAFTALVSGNLEKLISNEKIDGAHLALVGHGRDTANAKYSDWVRMRKPLEKLRPPSATELLLSNDGDHILEGCLTNFFVICRKDNVKDDSRNTEEEGLKSKYGFSVELQTAPKSDGVLPGVVREVIIKVCLGIGIPIREVAPSWSKRHLWEEAFITNSLRVLQHVETIRVPSSWNSLSSKTWKDVMWEEKLFQGCPGSITAVIQEEVMKRAKVEGHPVASFIK
ncbi:unnamed protein product [Lactuca virosa]|uniref:Aminotransferase class IV n=1 Tax=Lactuca virosa TaxID=75947 RepID=A0AAU9P8G3_9ASTR|nr:unnamed protein product [Lactuca virosa]